MQSPGKPHDIFLRFMQFILQVLHIERILGLVKSAGETAWRRGHTDRVKRRGPLRRVLGWERADDCTPFGLTLRILIFFGSPEVSRLSAPYLQTSVYSFALAQQSCSHFQQLVYATYEFPTLNHLFPNGCFQSYSQSLCFIPSILPFSTLVLCTFWLFLINDGMSTFQNIVPFLHTSLHW